MDADIDSAYEIGQGALTVQGPLFSNPHGGVECPHEYYVEMMNGAEVDENIVSYDESTGEFVFEAFSNFYEGTYQFLVYGLIGNYVSDIGPMRLNERFDRNPCVVTSVKSPTVKEQSYIIGSAPLTVDLPQYTFSPGTCSY